MPVKLYCAACWALIPTGDVAWQQLDGAAICSSCFHARQLAEAKRDRPEYQR